MVGHDRNNSSSFGNNFDGLDGSKSKKIEENRIGKKIEEGFQISFPITGSQKMYIVKQHVNLSFQCKCP